MRAVCSGLWLVVGVWWMTAQVVPGPSGQAAMPGNDLYKVRAMLREAYETVNKEYFDASFRGLALDTRYTEYDEKLKLATTMSAGFTVVAAFLDELNDSHTFFQPPEGSATLDYGYRLAVIGDDVYVARVKPGTDAESKVHPGDRVMSVDGHGVGRESFTRMQYILNTLQPQSFTRLAVRDPDGIDRTVAVDTQVTPRRTFHNLVGAGAGFELHDLDLREEADRHRYRSRHVEQGGVMIWKMPLFILENAEIDQLFATARKQTALILDLRGNPGGLVDALRRMLGSVFPTDVQIGMRVARKGRTPLTAKSRGADAFAGKLVVLIDGASGSSAELFARVVLGEGLPIARPHMQDFRPDTRALRHVIVNGPANHGLGAAVGTGSLDDRIPPACDHLHFDRRPVLRLDHASTKKKQDKCRGTAEYPHLPILPSRSRGKSR